MKAIEHQLWQESGSGALCLADGVDFAQGRGVKGVEITESSAPGDTSGATSYRLNGAVTITRAASIQREIDATADPLTFDLSGVEKMDTVGAWLIHRTADDFSPAYMIMAAAAVSLLAMLLYRDEMRADPR